MSVDVGVISLNSETSVTYDLPLGLSFSLSQNQSYKYFQFGRRHLEFSIRDDVRRVPPCKKYNLKPHIWRWNGAPICDTCNYFRLQQPPS